MQPSSNGESLAIGTVGSVVAPGRCNPMARLSPLYGGVMVGDIAQSLEREMTARVKILAGGQEYRLRLTAVALYNGTAIDVSQVPLGETCRIIGDDGMDYTAKVIS
jgi:hypothetical protein